MKSTVKRRVADGEPVGPFLKWAGGKSRLLPQYKRFFPETLRGRDYVEPFVGSGAVFFYVAQNLAPKRCTLLDVNQELVNAYCEIRDHVDDVIGLLTEHRAQHNASGITEPERLSYYKAVRAHTVATGPEGAARFIYLNKTCFNGLHRLNSRGLFNVPMGRYREPAIFHPERLRAVSRLLRDVRVEACGFQDCAKYIGDGDFVYLDPPYEPVSATANFTSYARDGFTQQNQRELSDLLRLLATRCDWMLSNSAAPLIDELYAGPPFFNYTVLASRVINSNAERRGCVEERVITNYRVADCSDGAESN